MSIVCDTVKDLVPLYLDGTISDKPGKFVKRHLKRCKSCSEYYHLCRHSDDVPEIRAKANSGKTDLIFAPDDGYELIAKRIEKRAIAERIAFIAGAVSAIAATVVIFMVKNKKDR